MGFVQAAPGLGNEYEDDFVLRSYLRRVLPGAVLAEIEPQLLELGRLSGGPLYALQQADRRNEPVHVPFDAWGNRIDRIELTAVWREAERIAAEQGIVATPYERRHGRFSRIHGLALAYLFTPSTDFFGCPLAMSDGAAAALLAAGPSAALDRALPHLLARDPAQAWTSGQWMTELAGGSDVSRTETTACRDGEGWRLYGRKWFTSAINSPMALVLARPEGAPSGSRGLALFYVETRDEAGRPNGVVVDRLKEKLGTRKLPTAELTLTGMPALPVGPLSDGVKRIAPMLNLTRTWNAMTAAALLGRGLRLARDYGRRRQAFGHALGELPLHADTLLGVEAEAAGSFLLAFRLAELLGIIEAAPVTEASGMGGPALAPGAGANEEADAAALLRILTPVAKLTTARQAVAGASELVEAFGGAGYIEDTGIPALLRDAQVLPIWEGTTDVLALDTLRALEDAGGLATIEREAVRRCAHLTEPRLARLGGLVCNALADAEAWLNAATAAAGPAALEAGARRFALQLGRALELALLVDQAQWALESAGEAVGRRLVTLARRFAAQGVAPIFQEDLAGQQPAS